MKTKNKLLSLILIFTFVLSACSAGKSVGDSSSVATAIPTVESTPIQLEIPTAHAASTSVDASNKQGGGTPPQEAITACASKAEQDTCEFTSNKGTETGVCEMVQSQLACSPKRDTVDGGQPSTLDNQHAIGSAYNLEQAISDKAQGMTISFDAMADRKSVV